MNLLSPSPNTQVKIYLLNREGSWDDCGIGTLSLIQEQNPITEVEEIVIQITSDDSNFVSTVDQAVLKKF